MRLKRGAGWAAGRQLAAHPRALAGVAAVLAAVSAAVAVTVGSSAGALPPVVPRVAGPAPDFNLAAVSDRGSVRLSAEAGRPVILSFFASWCTECRQELATMASLAMAAGTRVRVVGIDVNDESGPARSVLHEDDIRYPVGTDPDGVVASHYGLVGLPTTVYLDASHRVLGRTVGPLTAASGRAWVGALERAAA